ncbi:Aste57867_19762 [Aphanomyces stellatus]|uniref:Aste57867_19762 protein n=1 Tax=Aphanomyces stellatus TaxID=120398 RepID=A0A485LDB9_9STRA|nr:hypothetical protein As57867_019697 [Aphanomyces stellatus]VFT96460.1 Aste57867_19762 [Aphanomyces stellatus]
MHDRAPEKLIFTIRSTSAHMIMEPRRHSLMSLRDCEADTYRVVLHSGHLMAQTSPTKSHLSLFRRKSQAWSMRYMVLTQSELQVFDTKGGSLLGSIDVRKCTTPSLEVRANDAPSSPSKTLAALGWNPKRSSWQLAVNTPAEGQLVVEAASEKDMNQWTFALLALFKANEARMRHRHRHSQLFM